MRIGMPTRHFALLAMLASAAVHALAFHAVRIRPARPAPPLRPRAPACTMPADDADGEAFYAGLGEWCRVQDPGVLTLPDTEVGFSQVLASPSQRPYTSPPDAPIAVSRDPEAPFPPLTPPRDVAAIPAQRLLAFPLLPPDAPSPAGARLPAQILWREAGGAPLETPPKLADKDVLAVWPAAPVTAPTRLEIARAANACRIALRQSCGNAGLDQLALATVGQRVAVTEGQWQCNREVAPGPFAPEAGSARTLEVEWRLVGATATEGVPP